MSDTFQKNPAYKNVNTSALINNNVPIDTDNSDYDTDTDTDTDGGFLNELVNLFKKSFYVNNKSTYENKHDKRDN
jgi:hypothetical protein